MSIKRTLATVVICGFLPVLVSAAIDGRWPDYGPARWLFFVGGLAVIGLAAYGLQTTLDKSRAQRNEGVPRD